MERICIIGGSGTGKTTLANNLGTVLNIPVFHIDGINYLKNWMPRDEDERNKIILEKVATHKWIIDGTYKDTLQKRLEMSDYVIYLDYSTLAQIIGVLKRFISLHGKEREEIPGCKERMNWKFFCFVFKWRKNNRKKIMKMIDSIDKSKVLIFNNRRQLNRWYKTICDKKIHV